jgi:hypothetical protein
MSQTATTSGRAYGRELLLLWTVLGLVLLGLWGCVFAIGLGIWWLVATAGAVKVIGGAAAVLGSAVILVALVRVDRQ